MVHFQSRLARIAPAKLRDYLLCPTHPSGHTKQRFFARLDYSRKHWSRLATDLRRHLRRHTVLKTEVTEYGTKIVIRGSLRGPSGVRATVTAVWIVLETEEVPRFVTAYPGDGP